MKELIFSVKNFHPVVITLLAGTIFVIIGISMSSPFLAIYLAKNTELNAALIGAVIGVGPLAGAFGGFWGGIISDKIGRKLLITVSLFFSSVVFLGYAYTKSTILIVIFIMVGGVASSIFSTVSRALIADLTTKEQRVKVFSLQNLALNIGWGIGPVIGVLFGLAASQTPFIITAFVYAIYAVTLGVALKVFKVKEKNIEKEDGTTLKDSLFAMRGDKALLFFVVAGMVMAVAWAQFPILLSQFVTSNFKNGTEIFGQLLAINAFIIILVQIPISKWAEGKSSIFSLSIGVMFASAGLLGFGLSFNLVLLLVGISLLSLAETLVGPISNVYLDEIAPEKLKGAYFGAQNIGLIGMFLSPIVGGFILDIYGGRIMYFILAIICVSSMFLFYISYRFHSKNKMGEVSYQKECITSVNGAKSSTV